MDNLRGSRSYGLRHGSLHPCRRYPRVAGARLETIEEQQPSDSQTQLHALIIGIDQYKSARIRWLSGAASDADAVDKYLRDYLHVPTHQIVNLRNGSATHSAIIREFRALAENGSIRRNDPILIYFAGHGDSELLPTEWQGTRDKISKLVPYDTYDMNEGGRRILPIPSCVIGELLCEIAEGDGRRESGKGNNITVILDCCHSGSGTRGFAPSGLSSHVLLAACLGSEEATERDSRGKFTTALLQTLREAFPDRLTYKDLMLRTSDLMLRTPDIALKKSVILTVQTPQCEGHYTDRILFTDIAFLRSSVVYTVTRSDAEYSIDAGSAHGIKAHDQFAIYPSRSFGPSGLGTPSAIMKARDVRSYSTTVSLVSDDDQNLPVPCFASHLPLDMASTLCSHIPRSKTNSVLDMLVEGFEGLDRERPVIPREEETRTDLSVHALGYDGLVQYRIDNPLLKSLGLRWLSGMTEALPYYVHRVLQAGNHFFWHFTRQPLRSLLQRHLDIQVHQLRKNEVTELEIDPGKVLKTSGEDVMHCFDHTVFPIADGTAAYGVTISNKTPLPLHVWVFGFDCSDLSISEHYRPATSGILSEPDLPARGRLTIGYGVGGGRPFIYSPKLGQCFDVGFIKVFVSTVPVDLSGIAQRSPFEHITCNKRGIETRARAQLDFWDTTMITVFQRQM